MKLMKLWLVMHVGRISIKTESQEQHVGGEYICLNLCYTYEKINLNILNNIPLFGVSALDASQNVFKIHALPSNPCL